LICDLIVIDRRNGSICENFIKKSSKKGKLYILYKIKIVVLKKKFGEK
jgi:hypothetical protein